MRISRTEIAVIVILIAVAIGLGLSIDWSQGEPRPTTVKVFEDGSFVRSDGTSGCQRGGLCDR